MCLSRKSHLLRQCLSIKPRLFDRIEQPLLREGLFLWSISGKRADVFYWDIPLLPYGSSDVYNDVGGTQFKA
jgi:hypothetical protein